MSEAAPAYFGRYQVLEELGQGAMGIVFLCVDPRLARPVAIKVLRDSDLMSDAEREQYHARFRHEAEAAGRMNHPNIVQIFDIGPAYLVMEFLEGRTLAALLRSGVSFSLRQVCGIATAAADALDYAHRNGIVHRDIKPGNVMITDENVIKVMDFGVARLESSTLTQAGTVVGSVRYMAPEQMMGQKVDGRADVFSLGAVVYELLTGRAPFPGKTITEVVSRVVHGSHVPPRQVDPRLPEEMNAVFARVFATKPDARYARALDFARELQVAAARCPDLEIRHEAQADSPRTVMQVLSPTVHAAPSPPPPPVAAPSPPPPAAAPPQPPPATPPASVVPRGVLALDSDPPGARVFVDGQPAGRTPLGPVQLTFGRYLVRMEADGYGAFSTEIELHAARPVRSVGFTLPRSAPDQQPVAGSGGWHPGMRPARRLSGAVPAYPEAARERGLEGSPVVEILISETGEVTDAAVVESAGNLLDLALLQAVEGWRYEPARQGDGSPTPLRLLVQHHFRR